MKKSLKSKIFNYLDSHKLNSKQVEDHNHLENLISDLENSNSIEELEEDEVIKLISEYQIHYRKTNS